MFKCWDCGGSGIKSYYAHVHDGVCFTCKGSGITNKPTQANPYDEYCGMCNSQVCMCEPQASDYCEEHGLLGCNECK